MLISQAGTTALAHRAAQARRRRCGAPPTRPASRRRSRKAARSSRNVAKWARRTAKPSRVASQAWYRLQDEDPQAVMRVLWRLKAARAATPRPRARRKRASPRTPRKRAYIRRAPWAKCAVLLLPLFCVQRLCVAARICLCLRARALTVRRMRSADHGGARRAPCGARPTNWTQFIPLPSSNVRACRQRHCDVQCGR